MRNVCVCKWKWRTSVFQVRRCFSTHWTTIKVRNKFVNKFGELILLFYIKCFSLKMAKGNRILVRMCQVCHFIVGQKKTSAFLHSKKFEKH